MIIAQNATWDPRILSSHLDSLNFSGGDCPLRGREGGGHLRPVQEPDRGDAQGAARLLLQEPPAEGKPGFQPGEQWCQTVAIIK